MNRVRPRNDIRQATFMRHLIMLVWRLVMTIGKHGQATALRLQCMGTRSTECVGWRWQGPLVRVRLRNRVQVVFLKSAATSTAMGATANICCVEYQNMLRGDMEVAAYPWDRLPSHKRKFLWYGTSPRNRT